MTRDCERLIAFYSGTGVDHRGRTIEDVLRLAVPAMESTHDYIQWLFPLDEPSSVATNAPVLDELCRRAFTHDPALGATLLRSLDKMLGFYGMKVRSNGDGTRVVRASYFARRAPHWLTPGNHNFLRLTRMMKSLSLLGQQDLARALAGCLEGVIEEFPDAVGPHTPGYWRSAVRQRSGESWTE